ncbi:MAG TPA: hypothetical protein VK968_08785, partial [Roseimicrobium sp.]|nr:hypothetical protein [Roseimicrobium sp.]
SQAASALGLLRAVNGLPPSEAGWSATVSHTVHLAGEIWMHRNLGPLTICAASTAHHPFCDGHHRNAVMPVWILNTEDAREGCVELQLASGIINIRNRLIKLLHIPNKS